MEGYYEELANDGDNARADGWRDRLEQWLRFEAVIRGLAIEDHQSVLDLGCGTGELLTYLGAERQGAYLGVDRFESSIGRARKRGAGRFVSGDLFDIELEGEGRFDWAVAIGTLVDGEVARDAASRRRSLNRLVDRLDDLGTMGWALVVLNQERLERDLVRSLEPCLRGATVDELRQSLARRGCTAWIDDAIVPTDLFVLVRRDGEPSMVGERLKGAGAHSEVLRRARESWAPEADEVVRFWVRAGRREQAQQALSKVAATHRHRRLLEQRVQALKNS